MSLNFAITGDNTDLKKKLYESKQAIADTGNSVKSQSDSIMNSVKTIAAGVGIGFGIAQAKNLVGEIINVRGEFQKYEAVLTNTFQSNTRAAESMGMITEFASKTPFQLNELTDSYVKLVNQGFTPTRNEMRQLGDLASSTGKGFNQLTDQDEIKIWVRASRTGTNFKIGLHDSGGTTTESNIAISSADTWEQKTIDISAVANANKDAIDSIILTITNADEENIIYLDEMLGYADVFLELESKI